MLRELGGIDAVLGAGVALLSSVERIGGKTAEQIARGRDGGAAAAELARAGRRGVRVLCLEDAEYPAALKKIPDAPACLYVRGRLVRQDALALAIVGARRCTRYGAEQAERFGALAGSAGMTIVSGMARGIDGCAHRGALAAGARTIAVLGCGLNHLYPPDAHDLSLEIVEHGALLSELPMDVAPDAKNFPPRNRIISGLSMGVLVIEAARRSGALITARLAVEYDRESFALPGRVDSAASQGCHELIQTGGAKLVWCLEDILDEFGATGRHLLAAAEPQEAAQPDGPALKLDAPEQAIVGALQTDPMSVEALCDVTGMAPAKVAAALTGLQLKGVVRREAGDVYSLRRRG
jgi:DNA processing protein